MPDRASATGQAGRPHTVDMNAPVRARCVGYTGGKGTK